MKSGESRGGLRFIAIPCEYSYFVETVLSKINLKALKRIFVVLTVFMALVLSSSSYGQLSIESLKKICVRRYNKEFMSGTDGWQNSSDSIYVAAEERYKGVFVDVKLFSVTQGNCDDCRISTYVLDRYTGERPDLRDIAAFNKEINKSQISLTNYDKSCFYLEFNELAQNTTPASLHYKYITRGSIYHGIPGAGLIGYGNSWVDWHKYSDYIDRSSKRRIYVGAVVYSRAAGRKVRIYEFNFDKHDQLTSVVHFDVD